MKVAASQSSRKSSLGCLVFFAVPFVCVGVGVSWWAASLYQKHLATQSWTEVPATITYHDLTEGIHTIGGTRVVAQFLNHPAMTLEPRL